MHSEPAQRVPPQRPDAPVAPRSLAEARSTLYEHGRTFHAAARLLAPDQRDRAARLYAFCRFVDDLADCSADADQARSRLGLLRSAITQRRARCAPSAGLLALADDVSMPLSAAVALIDGALSDLSIPIFSTERELVRYSYRVAGTVGLMMCPVLDVHDRNAWPRAIDLGIGMQLTNIARDIKDDAQSGRIYLPTEWTGIDAPPAMTAPDRRQAKQLASGVRRLLDLAERYYASGMGGLRFLPFRARLSIHAAARMYREIGREVGREIDRHGYERWDKRTIVSGTRKLWLSIYGISIEAASIPPSPMTHDARLHRHLDLPESVLTSIR